MAGETTQQTCSRHKTRPNHNHKRRGGIVGLVSSCCADCQITASVPFHLHSDGHTGRVAFIHYVTEESCPLLETILAQEVLATHD